MSNRRMHLDITSVKQKIRLEDDDIGYGIPNLDMKLVLVVIVFPRGLTTIHNKAC